MYRDINTLPFFGLENFSINIFIFSFAKCRWKSCDGFTKYPFVISILRHSLPPRPPLNLCIILPLNRARLLGISNWNYPRREEFSLSLSASSARCRIFTLPLCHQSHSQFLIMISIYSPDNFSVISIFLSFLSISLLLYLTYNQIKYRVVVILRNQTIL